MPLATTGSMADSVGMLNPFRYRGYVYDEETELYYLRSRYYKPSSGRFIITDERIGGEVNGNNTYCYCANNPLVRSDSDGAKWYDDFLEDVGDFFVGIWEGMRTRADAAWSDPSFYNIANYLTMGVVESNTRRFEAAAADPSLYNIGNYLTSGTFDVVKGTFAPEEPLSFNHWMSSFGTACMAMPLMSKAASFTFNGNNGYGFKIGENTQLLYKTPKTGGGVFIAYNNRNGFKYHIDYDYVNYPHFHFGTGKAYKLHRKLTPSEILEFLEYYKNTHK